MYGGHNHLRRTHSFLYLLLFVSLIPAVSQSQAKENSTSDSVVKSIFGEMPDGTPIERYTLTNVNGIEAQIMTYGATLIAVKVPGRDGHVENVTLYLDTFADYLKGHPLFGSVVGRFANRIAGAKFEVDGTVYSLTPNAGKNHIHGGRNGFQSIVWQAAPIPEPGRIAVDLTHASPDGHEGYPGNLEVRVRYELTNDNELILEYTAKTDKPTVLNLTNHAYWNLAGAGSGDVLNAMLTLNADYYLPSDRDKIPTGEILPVKDTPMDFTKPATVGSRIGQVDGENYDHCYAVKKETGQDLAFLARVYDPASGRVMEVQTTQPGVQLYTASHLSDRYKAGGKSYGPYYGLCLETQNYPDAPNKPHFPSAILRPGEVYQHTTIFKFSVEK